MWHECECEGDCLQKSITECTTHAWSRWATAEENPISCHSAQLCPTGNWGYNSQTIGKIWLVWEVSISDATFGNGINVQIIPSPQWPHLYAWDVLEQEICITDLQPANLQEQREATVSIASHNWTKISEEQISATNYIIFWKKDVWY